VANVVTAGDLAHWLAVAVAAANRFRFLMLGQLRPAAHLDAARLGHKVAHDYVIGVSIWVRARTGEGRGYRTGPGQRAGHQGPAGAYEAAREGCRRRQGLSDGQGRPRRGRLFYFAPKFCTKKLNRFNGLILLLSDVESVEPPRGFGRD